MFVVFVVAVAVVEAFKPFLVAKTVIRAAQRDQLLGVFLINGFAFALDIRTVVPSYAGTLVRGYSRRLKRAVNKIDRAFDIALLVGILDTQNELAAVMTREQIGIEGGPQIPDVHEPRRRRGKSGSDFHMLVSVCNFRA